MSASFYVDIKNTAVLGYSYFGTISSDTTTNGTGVDCLNVDGPVHALVTTGNVGDASTVVLVKLQESTDNSTFTDITGATKTYAASATANDTLFEAPIKTDNRTKRYVRAVIVTSGGGTPSVPIAVGILGRKKISGTGTGTHTSLS